MWTSGKGSILNFSCFQFCLIYGQVDFFSNFDVFIFQFFSIFRQPAHVEFSQTSRKYDRLREKICFPKKWNLFRCSFEKVLLRCNIEPERKCVKHPDHKSLGLETQIWKDGSILDTAVRGVDYQFVYKWVHIQNVAGMAWFTCFSGQIQWNSVYLSTFYRVSQKKVYNRIFWG